ncbi:MAG: Zn-ribbon domain-containing OB-fold protein [Burkholderiaceae bacterium]
MNKPLPKPTAETLPFWQACAQGRLVYQHCDACGRAQFPPRGHCASCHAAPLAWLESARVGTVHSHTTVQRAPLAAFKADVPMIALVDLDEGFRMMTNVRGAPPDAVRIGARVRIVFEDIGGEWPRRRRCCSARRSRSTPSSWAGSTATTPRPSRRSSSSAGARAVSVGPARPPKATCPPASRMIATRAYMHVLHPGPPGNVHAGSMVTIHTRCASARVTTGCAAPARR